MKKKSLIFVGTIILFLILVYFLIPQSPKIQECQINSDCIPASCCHADSCVPQNQKPNCTDIFCSMNCESSLDCGAGSCGCVKNKCEVISK